MAATDFTVAIELGSTEITGIAGKKNADGSIHLLAYASERSSDCIKKGAIYNLDKTAHCLSSVIHQLEDKLQASIKKVYVGVGGQSIHSIKKTITKHLEEDTKISQHLIDSMLQSNREMSLLDKELLAVEPQEYKVGNNMLMEPVGIQADHIEGNFLNIIARDTLKSNIAQCFKQAGYEIADYLMAPLVTADSVLTTNEKRSGCALIDFGADTTTVTVYKNNLLRHIAVIPLGSSNITKDICSQQIEEEDAESLKVRYASAYTEPVENEDESDDAKEYRIENKASISAILLNDIVEARVKEILNNVLNQIVLSKYGDKLLAGIVITGGACNLPNLDTALKNLTQIDKIRIAKSSEVTLEGDIVLPEDGTCNTLIGILSAGKENCCRINPMTTPQLDFKMEQESVQTEGSINTTPTVEVIEPVQTVQGVEDTKSNQVEEEQQRLAQEEEERVRQEKAKQEQEDKERLEQEERERDEKKKVECQNLVREASQLILERKYSESLELLKKARLLEVASKMVEIDSLDKEATRLLDESIRVEQLKALEIAKENERALNRAKDCRDLIDQAKEQSDKKHNKNALSLLEQAAALNVAEYKEEIETLKAEIGNKSKSWIYRLYEKAKTASDNLMNDDE